MPFRKDTRLWFWLILFISIIASMIGNIYTKSNVLGGVILVLILFMIPFGIELIRGKDPLIYYGLDFATLRKINMKTILGIAILVFGTISIIDHFAFNLFKLLLSSNGDIAVGSAAINLAKSNAFYLAIIVFFSGTLLEELWFRGFVQYKLNSLKFLKPLNPHLAIITQSILFGLAHFVPIYSGTNLPLPLKYWFFVYPFLVGIINGYINDKYHSLWPGWIIHYTNNVLGVVVMAIIYRV